MPLVLSVLVTLVGVVLVVLGLRDMFHTLLHPSGRGAISHVTLSLVWRVSKRAGQRFRSVAGPEGMVAVVFVWVLLQAGGWALVYLPHVPEGFVYSQGVDPARYNDFTEALYISLVTLATVGFGDVVAVDPWIRLASPLEAVAGFALLTAALTWFTQVYPPLSRRHVLALQLSGLAEVDYADDLPGLDPAVASRVIEGLGRDIGTVSVDFSLHQEGYYFHETDAQRSLAHQLPYALTLRDAAARSRSSETRAAAGLLSQALAELSTTLREGFLSCPGDSDDVFAAYAADHGLTHRR